MSDSMEVTTTGFSAAENRKIVLSIQKAGHSYNNSLSSKTAVLIVKTDQSEKFDIAKKRSIHIVTRGWAEHRDSPCSAGALQHYAVRPLFRKSVCTTALSAEQRKSVSDACALFGADFQSSLRKHAHILVVPPNGAPAGNDKVVYAEKQSISIVAFDDFFKKICDAALPPGSPIRRSASKEVLVCGMSRVRCYCTPSNLVTPEVRTLIQCVGATRVPAVSANTTHVLVLGPSCEDISPEGRVAVTLKWFQDCLAAKDVVEITAAHMVAMPGQPVVTLGSMSPAERAEVTNLVSASLRGTVRDLLLVGSVASDGALPTTHLVVPQKELRRSQKVAAVVDRYRRVRRQECAIADPEWVRASARAGRWLDVADYAQDISTLSSVLGLREEESPPPPAAVHVPPAPPVATTQNLLQLDAMVSKLEGHLSTKVQRKRTRDDIRIFAPQTNCVSLDNSPLLNNSYSTTAAEPSASFSFTNTLNRPPQAVPLALRAAEAAESQVVVYHHDDQTSQQLTRQPLRLSKKATAREPEPAPAAEAGAPADVAEASTPSSRKKVFLLAKAIKDDATQLSQVFEQLGAGVTDKVAECTHYVVPKPSKTATFLCAVAAGKWILRPEFAEACKRQRSMPLEEQYEWAPKAARECSAQQTVDLLKLLEAAELQRKRGGNAFADWSALLLVRNETRGQSFARVLESGGCRKVAVATSTTLATCSLPERVTHVLCDDAEMEIDHDLLWDRLRNGGASPKVVVAKMEYFVAWMSCMAPMPHLEISASRL